MIIKSVTKINKKNFLWLEDPKSKGLNFYLYKI